MISTSEEGQRGEGGGEGEGRGRGGSIHPDPTQPLPSAPALLFWGGQILVGLTALPGKSGPGALEGEISWVDG